MCLLERWCTWFGLFTKTNVFLRSFFLATNGTIWQAVRILIKAGASLESTTDQLFTPLLIAAFNGKLELIKCLVAAGAHIEARNTQHYTALGIAAQQGYADILGFLLDRYLPLRLYPKLLRNTLH